MKRWIVVMLAACGAEEPSGPVDPAALFAKWCSTCHGPTGKPSEQMAASLHPRDLTSAEFRARVTPALVENQVRVGSQNHMMPSFAGGLSNKQIAALAAWVASPEFLKR